MLNPIEAVGVRTSVNNFLPVRKSSTPQMVSPVPNEQSVKATQVLSQMPNVSFTAYGLDDLSAYENSDDPFPPEIEQRKYRLTVSAAQDIKNGDYLSAMKKKIHIADICKAQGKDEDVEKLVDGIWRLFRELPKDQLVEAAKLLSNF